MLASKKFPSLPVQVYLDSADFSVLSDTKIDAEWRTEIISRLQRGTATGAIQLRFSAVHIIEASPLSIEVADSGAARLRLIRELCGNHALRFYTDLAAQELRVHADKEELTSIRIHADDGRWIPDIDDFAADLEKDKRELV